ncbi:MAG: ligand-binding sensor domain-containing protein/GGDEF domain-containing protein [Colwellia sp.]|jgi:ligand-binding sensor domain-containing protein/GGDEF domain-containing protein
MLCFSCLVASQDIKMFKGFGVDNPMSYKFVRTIAQDKNGFMWFGSSEGLSRFDGHNFISFHHDNDLSNSLSSDVVSRIIIDKEEKLWVATFGGGLNLYRENSQDFLRFDTKTKVTPLTNDTVNALFDDSEGKIWIGTENGLNILSNNNNVWSIKHIKKDLGNTKSLTHNTIHAIIETKEQEIWVGTNGGGVSIFDINGNFIKSLESTKPNVKSNSIQFINSLFYDEAGVVWIGTVESGLLKFNLNLNTYQHYMFDESDLNSVLSNTIEKIYRDSQGNIWIATDKGLLIYDENNDYFQRYRHSASNPHSLSNDFVFTLFEDSNNIMWIGTFTGVNRWDPNMTTFSQFSTQTSSELKNNNITSFAQFDQDTIYFSTYSGGIYQLSINNNKITPAPFNDDFTNFRVMTLFEDEGTLWVGTRSSGLFSVDVKNNTIKSYLHDAKETSSISANSVTDIIKDSAGNLWVSTFHRGVNRLNSNGSFTRFELNINEPQKGPSSNHVLQLLEDVRGDIWLATFGGGLSLYNPEQDSFTHIKHDDTKPNSISSDLAWIIFEDRELNIWVGTQASGMNIISNQNLKAKNYTFRQLNAKHGMKSMAVYGITQDLSDNIWFSTSKGISRYSLAEESFKHFDLTHGLVDLEYTHSSVLLGEDNTLYFGAGKGISAVNPNRINTSQAAPKVHLTNILNLNEPISVEGSISNLSELTLEYYDRLISFEYVGLNYSNPESTKYKYRLLGFDQEWIDAGKSRRVTYTNLPAGIFQLQIIAGNSDNVWSNPGYSLDITVKPAPWNTWWAYILYTSIVALALLLYSRMLNRKLVVEQQQKLYLEQQVHEKTEKFTSKNLELAQANKQLEKAAIVDKVTGVKSRRYLDIYIEQTSQLMHQMHQNLLPVQREMLPRLYILMVRVKSDEAVNNSQLINLTDLLHYSRNNDDLVIRWSSDTFAVIGYEKGNNANELAARLSGRLNSVVNIDGITTFNMAYSFFPFSRENPLHLSWDQISVMIEQALNYTDENKQLSWLGLCGPKSKSLDYLQLMQQSSFENLKEQIIIKSGLT